MRTFIFLGLFLFPLSYSSDLHPDPSQNPFHSLLIQKKLSPAFLNQDFVKLSRNLPNYDDFYLSVSNDIIEVVGNFFIVLSTSFVLTAIIQLDYMANEILVRGDLPEDRQFQVILSLGKSKAAIAKIVKDVPLFFRFSLQFAEITLSARIRKYVIEKPILEEFFPSNSPLLELVFNLRIFRFHFIELGDKFEIRDKLFAFLIGESLILQFPDKSERIPLVVYKYNTLLWSLNFEEFDRVDRHRLLCILLSYESESWNDLFNILIEYLIQFEADSKPSSKEAAEFFELLNSDRLKFLFLDGIFPFLFDKKNLCDKTMLELIYIFALENLPKIDLEYTTLLFDQNPIAAFLGTHCLQKFYNLENMVAKEYSYLLYEPFVKKLLSKEDLGSPQELNEWYSNYSNIALLIGKDSIELMIKCSVYGRYKILSEDYKPPKFGPFIDHRIIEDIERIVSKNSLKLHKERFLESKLRFISFKDYNSIDNKTIEKIVSRHQLLVFVCVKKLELRFDQLISPQNTQEKY